MIEVHDLSRSFEYYRKQEGLKGSFKNIWNREIYTKVAVDKVSFHIEKGEIIGLLGANGAGKTTTLKMLSGILSPTSGIATVNGFIPSERKKEYKKMISVLLGNKSQLWTDLPAIDSFEINKCIYDIPTIEYKKRVEELSEMLNVTSLLHTQVRRLSLGEKMKLEIISALLHQPNLLLLDEPTIGLDFLSQKAIRKFILDYNKEHNATILITSHNIADIEALCKRVIIINDGKVAYDGDINKINSQMNQYKNVKLRTENPFNEKLLSDIEGVLSIKKEDEYTPILTVHKDSISVAVKDLINKEKILDLNITEFPIEEQIEHIMKCRS